MKIPYCIVDGKEYQLVESESGVIRFPDTKEPCSDLNKLIMNYARGHIDLEEVWIEYTQTGTSFGMVEGLFSRYGTNSHTVTNGDGKFKKFELFSGDEEIDNYYKDSNVGIQDRLQALSEMYEYDTDEDRINELEVILNELKSK